MPSDEDYPPRSRHSRRPQFRYNDDDDDGAGDVEFSDDQAPPPRRSRYEDQPSHKEAKPRARARRDPDELDQPPSSRYQDPRDIEPTSDRKMYSKPKRRETYDVDDDDDDDMVPRRKPRPKDMDALPRQRRGLDAVDNEDADGLPPRRHKPRDKDTFPEFDHKHAKNYDIPPMKNEGRRRAATFDDYAPPSRHKASEKKDPGFITLNRGHGDDDDYDDPPPPPRRKDRRHARDDRYDEKGDNILPATAGAALGAAAGAGAGAVAAHRRRQLDDNDRGYRSDRDRIRDREKDRDRAYGSDSHGGTGSGRRRGYDDEPLDRGYRSGRRDDPYHDRDRERPKPRRPKYYDDDHFNDNPRGYSSDLPSSRKPDSYRDRDRGYRSDRDKARRSSKYDSYSDRDRDRDSHRDRNRDRDRKKKSGGLGGFSLDADSLGKYYETGQKHYKTFKPIIDSVAKMYLNNKR